MIAPSLPSDGWVRYPHKACEMTNAVVLISGTAPLAMIRASAPGAQIPARTDNGVRAHALLDTGASATMVPMRALRHTGVELDGESKTTVAGATGWARPIAQE